MARRTVAIVGATGYGGAEAVRILLRHPEFEIVAVTSARSDGKPLRQECPWLDTDLVLTAPAETYDADFVLLAQESGYALENAHRFLGRSRVVDLSADFRLDNPADFEKFYGRAYETPVRRDQVAYGLPELTDRNAIAQAEVVANPGCHVTASLLAMMPALQSGHAREGFVTVDTKTGVSGAGRAKRDAMYLFSEATAGVTAYGISGHRHTPEIEMIAGRKVRFTPHLVPMARGLLATVVIPAAPADWSSIYRQAYADEPFVRLVDTPPSTKAVTGTNRADVFVQHDPHVEALVAICVIDNLGKGAAGQAVQNLNLMAGLPEPTGIPIDAVWP